MFKPLLDPGGGFTVEVLELTLHGDIYLVMGVRDSKGQGGGRRTIDKRMT